MAAPDGTLHALQEGFAEMHGLQCGFCTPGMIMRAHRLLQENPDPSEAEIRMGISGNICRCTGYQNIVKAIRYAADKMNAAQKEAAERATPSRTPRRRLQTARPAWRASAAHAGAPRTPASYRLKAQTWTT